MKVNRGNQMVREDNNNNNNNNNGVKTMEEKVNNTISFNDIKTPTSVEEFRENLTKYYVSIKNKVYIQPLGYVDVDKLDSMEDVVKMVEDKGYDIHSIQLTPSVIQTTKWEDWVEELTDREEFFTKGMDWVCVNWWLNDNNNIIFEFDKDNPNSFSNFTKLNSKYQKDIYWKNFFGEDCWDDNDNFRDFYIKTLGSYSGFVGDGDGGNYEEGEKVTYDVMVERYGDDTISNLNL